MLSCSRKIEFCYGHRIMGHENKCATLHGHNATVWIHAVSISDQETDKLGRVVDFSVLKEKVGGWIELHWDHTMVLFSEDKQTISLLEKVESYKSLFILDQNPTAEHLAHYLLWEVCPKVLQAQGVMVTMIEFYETSNCKAIVCAESGDLALRQRYGL